MTTFDAVISHFGSQRKLALALGITPAAITTWRRFAAFPELRRFQIEVISKGAFKAGELPDLDEVRKTPR